MPQMEASLVQGRVSVAMETAHVILQTNQEDSKHTSKYQTDVNTYCRCGFFYGLKILLILHTEEHLQSNFCS